MNLALTYFPRLRDAGGQRVRTTWPKLVERLSVPRVVADKHDAPGLSLCTFRGDRRALDRVERVYAVGLDLDEGVDWEQLVHLFDGNDAFLHTTWSSTEAEPRARVFLRLSRPVTGEEYRRCYAAVVERCDGQGLVVDRQASDPSRFWFLPSVPPGGKFHFSVGAGKPVSVDWGLATVPAAPPPPPVPSPTVSHATGDVESRAAAYVARCEPAISGSGGHTVTFKLAQRLVLGFDLDEETAYRLMLPWNARCEPPWSERELRRKVREAARRGRMAVGALRDAPLRRAS